MPTQITTTHVILPRKLIVYRRDRSGAWQCRFKCDDKWQRATTKETDLKKAKAAAHKLLVAAEIRKEQNLPVVTRRFRDVANLAIERMEQEQASGKGKVSFKDYIRVIKEYLIPSLGKRHITSIDVTALDELAAERIVKMNKQPTRSTLLTHNAALSRVFDEAVMRGFLTESNRPKLESEGKESQRRPAFTLDEVKAMIGSFDAWIERARTDISRETRIIMRDYVLMLLDTGARPGIELLELRWNKITENKVDPVVKELSKKPDEFQEVPTQHDLRRSVTMTVKGKTGTRDIVGMGRTVEVLRSIAARQYPDTEQPLLTPLIKIAKSNNSDRVFIRSDKNVVFSSFQKMFENFLSDHSLLIDPRTNQHRVFYSLRHTYATFALTHDQVPIHTLAKQMGTSVLMIERHYSHLKVIQAINQLRGAETRQLIDAGGVIDEMYESKKVAAKNEKKAAAKGKKKVVNEDE
jgi:integrase